MQQFRGFPFLRCIKSPLLTNVLCGNFAKRHPLLLPRHNLAFFCVDWVVIVHKELQMQTRNFSVILGVRFYVPLHSPGWHLIPCRATTATAAEAAESAALAIFNRLPVAIQLINLIDLIPRFLESSFLIAVENMQLRARRNKNFCQYTYSTLVFVWRQTAQRAVAKAAQITLKKIWFVSFQVYSCCLFHFIPSSPDPHQQHPHQHG